MQGTRGPAMVPVTLWMKRGETRKLEHCSAKLFLWVPTLGDHKVFGSSIDGGLPKSKDEGSSQGVTNILHGPRYWQTRYFGWMWRNSTHYTQPESLRGGSRDVPSGQKWDLASRNCMSVGVTRRESQVHEPTGNIALMLSACDTQHERTFVPAADVSCVTVLHRKRRSAVCERIDVSGGGSLQARTCTFASWAPSCRHCDAHFFSQRLHSGKSCQDRAHHVMTVLPRPWEVVDKQRRRRVRYHLIQAALWAPPMGEKMEWQDWEECAQVRCQDTKALVVQS